MNRVSYFFIWTLNFQTCKSNKHASLAFKADASTLPYSKQLVPFTAPEHTRPTLTSRLRTPGLKELVIALTLSPTQNDSYPLKFNLFSFLYQRTISHNYALIRACRKLSNSISCLAPSLKLHCTKTITLSYVNLFSCCISPYFLIMCSKMMFS